MGYSRAVRKANMIFVTGTVGINADKSYTPDVGAQAKRSLEIIKGAIESLGERYAHGQLRIYRTAAQMARV